MSKTVVAFGEILWDLLPDGRTLGGAPFNFVYRITGLGYQGIIVSAIGEDKPGEEAFHTVKKLGLRAEFIQRTAAWPTGSVNVFFDDHKQPDYKIIQKVAYDYLRFTPELEALSKSVDCIYYGTLSQRSETSRITLREFLDSGNTQRCPVKFLDVNLRKECYTLETVTASLDRATILKLNEEEAHEVASLTGLNSSGLMEIARKLVQVYSLDHCIITLAERGAFCYSKSENCVYDPGYHVNVVDPCGSGDAFSAGFIHKLFEEQTAAEGIRLGNIYGAIVASQRGATASFNKETVMSLLKSVANRLYHPEFVNFASKEKPLISWKI